MIDRVFKFFCSLRLTVVLLGAGLVLVFVGTLAQVHEGLFQAQVRYFKSWYIWKPTIGDGTWPILLPGGYLLGTLLLLNLLAAQSKRFQFTFKKLGINMIHGGLVLLLLGQLLTDIFSQESSMTLFEGLSSNYSEDYRANELVFYDDSDPKSDLVVSIPERDLARKSEISNAMLPVTVKVLNYWQNADLTPTNAVKAIADRGAFTNIAIQPLPDSAEAGEDVHAAVLVEVSSAKGSLGTYLVPSQMRDEQTVKIDGKDWTLSCLFAPMMGGNVLALAPAGEMGGAGMITFPEAELKRGGDLKREGLPLTLQVKGYWAKCRLFAATGPTTVVPVVTKGRLRGEAVTPLPHVTDTDHRDMPAAVVQLSNNNGILGTWLMESGNGQTTEPFQVGDKVYRMALQFKRYYQPYAIGLNKFTHDIYKGTDIPKNFAARVQVINPATHENRPVEIKMNYPLRYQGTTYYQASFDEHRPDETILEVVTNPGWLTPYLACVLVGLGLIIQFMMHLVGFAMKRKKV